MQNLELQQWLLYTPYGRYILMNERMFYHKLVHSIFGYYSLQIGLEGINFLQGNKIPNHYKLGNDVQCELNFLPFENNSIDLILCPHVLEFHNNYYHFLQECYRILSPNGKLIVTSFNSNYLFKYVHKTPFALKQSTKIKLETLKYQLQELNFSIKGGKFFCYLPIINNPHKLSNIRWIDKIGDRWFPTMGHNFGLVITKDVVTPIKSLYHNQINRTPRFIPNLIGKVKICNNK